MKKSQLRKIIRESIKGLMTEQGIHPATVNPTQLSINFTNRVDSYSCYKLLHAKNKLNMKLQGTNLPTAYGGSWVNYPQPLPDFAGGANPRWYTLLQTKHNYVTQLIQNNNC